MHSTKTDAPMQVWAADFLGPFPPSHQMFKHLLVLTDHFNKFSLLFPLVRANTRTLCSILNQVFCTYGSPDRFVSDNGPQFLSKRLRKLLAEWSVLHTLISPYHLQSNWVERVNRDQCSPRFITLTIVSGPSSFQNFNMLSSRPNTMQLAFLPQKYSWVGALKALEM